MTTMEQRKKDEDAKRAEIDATLKRWTEGLANAVQNAITNLKIPGTPNATLIVSSTLIRIGCRLAKDQNVEISKFMGMLEAIMQKEFTNPNDGPENAPRAVPHATADGQPLIILP